ncbi:hypothetical protein ZOSMA_56G00130 [Zostera marina]|uniref:Cytochrome P450 90A1 n=1 Tax=Zostera marina TaxID=29655 RepID=A0A0K9NXL0_ZOSMR|nr:hypothetical protein ZOSMA_56G00130 [Zostera marina]
MKNWISTLEFEPLLLLVLLILPVAVIWFARKRSRLSLPPGKQGFPLVGETMQFISAYRSDHPNSFMDERMEMHGQVFTSHVFGETTVFSSDPDVNRHVLQKEGRLFQSSYPSSIGALLGKNSIVISRGPYHKQLHSFTLASFSNQTVLRDCLLSDIDRLIRQNTIDAWKDGQTVILHEQAKKMTFEIAVKQLMSRKPGEWTDGLRRDYGLVIDGFLSIPFPFARLLPFTIYGRAIRAKLRIAQQIRSVVTEKIRGFASGVRSDVVDVLDKLLMEEGIKEEDKAVDYVFSLLVGIHETTSIAMTCVVKFLTENPAAMAELRKEHDKIKNQPDGGGFTWNNYKNMMPFTQCVITETLRMSNIASGVFRRCATDVDIKGFKIPKGRKIFASFRAVHMNEDYFEDARTFNPWRWMKKVDEDETEEDSKKKTATASDKKRLLCVFGGGPRLCPGYELSRLELCVFLHYLVTSFTWDAAGEDSMIFFPTIRTVKGFPIRVSHRSSCK